MLKNALKNFFVNLKYVFTPLGVMFLGALSGLAVLISSVTTAVSELSSGVTALLNRRDVSRARLDESRRGREHDYEPRLAFFCVR